MPVSDAPAAIMPHVLSTPRRGTGAACLLALLLVLAGCSPNSTSPKPTPSASGLNEGLRCSGDDVPLNVVTLGWGFCHPKGWSIVQRSISTSAPVGVDTTLDVVASDGFFGFMIVGSYERGGAADLKAWLASNAPGDTDVQPITWGNAAEAVQVNGQLKRYALTGHRVYALTEREGAGNLDVDAAMQPRLSTWSFVI
jgi:hypothetical protein